MVKKRFILLWLAFGVIGPVLGASESKGGDAAAGVVDGLDGYGLDYKIVFNSSKKNDPKSDPVDDIMFYTSSDFINRFERLRVLSVDSDDEPVYRLELPDTVVSFDALSDLEDLIRTPDDFARYGFVRLVQLINLASELQADQPTLQLLEPALNWLRQELKRVASPALAKEIKDLDAGIKIPLIIDDFKSNVLESVSSIYWSPDSRSYWVRFNDHTAQKYNAAGVPQGDHLGGVSAIYWQPDGSSYWVVFRDYRAQRYNVAGESQGAPLEGVFVIDWQPNGSSYWVVFDGGRAQRYNAAGVPQGDHLRGVRAIYWQPDSSSYWVVFDGGRAQRYNAAGVPQGDHLGGVSAIYWQPDSSSYWVRFIGGRAQRYNAAGEPQGAPLEGVFVIYWQPDSSSYWVLFNRGRAQRYNVAGVPQGALLERVLSIDLQPNGSSYWVRFNGGRTQIYNAAGEPQGSLLEDVSRIVCQPNGSSYWVLFDDHTAIRYQAGFENYPLYQQVMVQWIINQFESNGKVAINLSPADLDILTPLGVSPAATHSLEVVKQLITAGYIIAPGTGAGAGAGAGARSDGL